MASVAQDLGLGSIPKDDVLPEGDYLLIVTKSDLKETKAGDGEYYNLTLQVADGPKKGKNLFVIYNTRNKNETAQQMGRRDLQALIVAVGIDPTQIKDTQQIHDIPFCGHVKVKKRNDSDEMQNVISKYSPRSAYSGGPKSAFAEGEKAPWEK